MLSLIVAGVINDNIPGYRWEDPDTSSGFFVSHPYFNLKDNYAPGISTDLQLHNLAKAVKLKFLYFELHYTSLFFWRICDDYLKIQGVMDEFRLCGWGDLEYVLVYPRDGTMNLNLITSDEDFGSSEANGFLIHYEGKWFVIVG